jgi:putative ATP-dependent endonuclease of OLD family
LKKANEPDASKCPNVVILPGGNGFEEQLLAEGYLPEIEKAIDEIEGQANYLENYMVTLDGKPKKKNVIRDYKSAGARQRAANDYLNENKTRMAKPVAQIISALADPARRFPRNIEQILLIIGKEYGLSKAEEAK